MSIEKVKKYKRESFAAGVAFGKKFTFTGWLFGLSTVMVEVRPKGGISQRRPRGEQDPRGRRRAATAIYYDARKPKENTGINRSLNRNRKPRSIRTTSFPTVRLTVVVFVGVSVRTPAPSRLGSDVGAKISWRRNRYRRPEGRTKREPWPVRKRGSRRISSRETSGQDTAKKVNKKKKTSDTKKARKNRIALRTRHAHGDDNARTASSHDWLVAWFYSLRRGRGRREGDGGAHASRHRLVLSLPPPPPPVYRSEYFPQGS